MKIDLNTENYLLINGFVEGRLENEWVRGLWTIRFDKDKIEVFDNVDKGGRGVYLYDYLSDVSLLDIIEEIDEIENV